MATLLSKHCPLLKPSSRVIAAFYGSGPRQQNKLKESYVYHPRKETLEADVQAFLWTKTQCVDHVPQAVAEVRNGLKLNQFLPLMTPAILTSRVHEMQEVKMKYKNKPRDLTRGTHKNFPFSLMQNIFRIVLSHSTQYPQLRDLGLSLEPFVSASWSCIDDTISVRGRQDLVLNSKQPLSQFYDDQIVQNSANYTFQSLENALPFVDLKKYPVNDQFSTGYTDSGALFPHAHTSVVIDNGNYMEPPSKGVPEIQLLQKGLMFTFGRLSAQAVSKHGRDIIGKDLPQPECAQCIVTDGQTFSFLWYQLNTLNTNKLNDGVKNLAFIDRPGLLYSSVEPEGIFKKTVVGLSEDVLRTLLSVFLL